MIKCFCLGFLCLPNPVYQSTVDHIPTQTVICIYSPNRIITSAVQSIILNTKRFEQTKPLPLFSPSPNANMFKHSLCLVNLFLHIYIYLFIRNHSFHKVAKEKTRDKTTFLFFWSHPRTKINTI